MTDGQPGSTAIKEDDARELFYQEIVYLHQELKKRGLGREAISLQMVQVGRNAGATAFFKHCDDELPARCEGVDYVDCTKYQEGTDLKLTVYKILYGSAVGDLDAGALEKVAEALQRAEAMKAAMAKK